MQMFKWIWIVILSGFIVTASLPSVCLAKEAPPTIRTLELANGGVLKQVKENNRLIWTSLDKSGKRSIAHGAYKLQNGKVIKFNNGAYVKSKSTYPTRPNTSSSKKGVQNKPTILSTKVSLQNSLNNLQKSYALFLRNPNDIKTRGIFNNALDNATADADKLAKLSKDQDPQLGRTPQRPSTKSDSMTGLSKGQDPQLGHTPQRPSTGVPLPPNDRNAGKDDIAAFKGNVPIKQETGPIRGPSPVPPPKDPPPKPDPPPDDPPPKPPEQGPQGITKGEMTRLLNMANSLLGDFSNIQSISRMQTKMDTRSMNIIRTRMNGIQGKGRDLALLEPKAEP